jgi:predicted 2-oxoglutarate/Fe(II)-dependent dioxygenase YbiX
MWHMTSPLSPTPSRTAIGQAPSLELPTPIYKQLLPGDSFPWLIQACGGKPNFAFDTFAGRYQLYCFFLSAEDPAARRVLRAVYDRAQLFDDFNCSFIGVSLFNGAAGDLCVDSPGIRFAWDLDHGMSRACGVTPIDSIPGEVTQGRRLWILVDPSLHVLRIFPFNSAEVDEVLDAVAALPPPDRFGGVSRPAPILLLPNVFDQALCRRLIAAYDANGGEASGVHRDGKGVFDTSFKSRSDFTIIDPALLQAVKACVARRVLPEIEKLFFMQANYIERHIVGCYSAEDGGHFAPHRDNRPGLTSHRRFAISVNLNDDFEGGEVLFPEYDNTHGYKAPAGWAVVFPCAILHAVRRVTSGARYAYLPFVYDVSGRELRDVEFARARQSS